MRHYELLAEFEREDYDIIVDKSYEDLDPKDCFDDSCFDLKEMYRDIESGRLDWFMLRVRVMAEGVELGSHYLGGCLYEDAREVLKDGTAEDCISQALQEAKGNVYRIYKKFAALNEAIEQEGVNV